jgi:hypothetical protein
MKFAIFLYLIFYCFACSISQNINKNDNCAIEVDKLGNYYLIKCNGEIQKYSAENHLLYVYNGSETNDISCLDVSDPHKLLIFSRDYQTIKVLDKTMSLMITIQLDPSQNYDAIGTSNDSNIWLHNSLKNELSKIDFSGNQLEQNVKIETNIQNMRINRIFENDNMVFICDDTKGVLIFNNLGLYQKSLKLNSIENPAIVDNSFIYFDKKQQELISFDIDSGSSKTIKNLQGFNPISSVISSNDVLILTKDSIRKIKK